MSKVPHDMLLLAAVAQAVLPVTVLPAGARSISDEDLDFAVAISFAPVNPDHPTQRELDIIDEIQAERKQQEAVAASAFYLTYYEQDVIPPAPESDNWEDYEVREEHYRLQHMPWGDAEAIHFMR